MRTLFFLIAFSLNFAFSQPNDFAKPYGETNTISTDTLLMGSAFIFTGIHYSKDTIWEAINAAKDEVIRIERLISSWDENSETHQINRNAGIQPVKVSTELFNLIARCKKVSDLSNGYFDISFASIDKVWDFKKDYKTAPDTELIKQSVAKINYKKILLNREEHSVYLSETGMKIGFGAIGKGYAANRSKAVMLAYGIKSGILNAGGDLISWGNKEGGEPWSVGVLNPFKRDDIRLWLNVTDMAVVTSGDYERFVMIEGKRFGHIINPKTGWPTQGVSSVTVICSDAELADALATTVFVIGKKNGIALINEIDGVECLIIDDENEIFYSNKLEMNYILHSGN